MNLSRRKRAAACLLVINLLEEDEFGERWWKTADRKTIMNYHARGQTRKTIIDYHEDFEQVQTE